MAATLSHDTARALQGVFSQRGGASRWSGWQTVISADVIESLFAVAFGFTFAGLCASGCRLVALHLPNFRMLEAGRWSRALRPFRF
jgi:hypothetical protein